MDDNLRREIMIDNYQNPFNKEVPTEDGYIKINTNSESCIDNVDIYLKKEGDTIKDIKFDGEACAISTSATSIMIRMLIGKTINEALNILQNFYNMIEEKPYDKEVLKELNAYDKIYMQANRKGCALLPHNAIKQAIEKSI